VQLALLELFLARSQLALGHLKVVLDALVRHHGHRKKVVPPHLGHVLEALSALRHRFVVRTVQVFEIFGFWRAQQVFHVLHGRLFNLVLILGHFVLFTELHLVGRGLGFLQQVHCERGFLRFLTDACRKIGCIHWLQNLAVVINTGCPRLVVFIDTQLELAGFAMGFVQSVLSIVNDVENIVAQETVLDHPNQLFVIFGGFRVYTAPSIMLSVSKNVTGLSPIIAPTIVQVATASVSLVSLSGLNCILHREPI